MKKKILSIFFACALALVGCGGGSDPTVEPTPSKQPTPTQPATPSGQPGTPTPTEQTPSGQPGTPTPTEPAEIHVTGVSLNKTELTLDVNASETLVATVAPSNASDKSVTWSSSDPSVAKVVNGKVTALQEGSATITVATVDGNFTASCAVTVNPIVYNIQISNKEELQSDWSYKQGGRSLKLEISPLGNVAALVKSGEIAIASSDEEVATVSGTLITPLKAGEATITVTYHEVTDSVDLVFTEALPEPAHVATTVAEIISVLDDSNQKSVAYELTGVYIVEWQSGKADATKYGNYFIADSLEEGAPKILVYGSTVSTVDGEGNPIVSWTGAEYKFINPQDFLTNEASAAIKLKAKVDFFGFGLMYNTTQELNGIISNIDLSECDSTVYPEPAVKENSTIAEFVADTQGNGKQAFVFSGTVSAWKDDSAKDGTQYGNFYLKDGNDEIYIYGATATATALEWKDTGVYSFSNPKDFLTNDLTKDVKLGDKITIKATRCDYGGKLEGNGIVLAVEPGEPLPTPTEVTPTPTPVHGEVANDPLSFAEALALATPLEDGKDAGKQYYIAGTVVEHEGYPQVNKGRVSFYIGDGENELLVYNVNDFENKNTYEEAPVKAGDAVVVAGTLKNYQGTLEVCYVKDVAQCYFISINGEGLPEPTPTPTPTVEPTPTEAGHGEATNDPLTVAEALALATPLEDAQNAGKQYYVAGRVVEHEGYPQLKNGRVSFYIGDGENEMLVYNCQDLENKASYQELPIQVGDEVVVAGTLKNYQGTLEICYVSGVAQCYFISINGQGFVEQDVRTYYFSNNQAWEEVYAYVWKNGDPVSVKTDWPGELATYVGDNELSEKVYSYEVDVNQYDNIIFNNGSDKQTADIALAGFESGTGFFINDSVEGYGTYEYQPLPTPTPTGSDLPKAVDGVIEITPDYYENMEKAAAFELATADGVKVNVSNGMIAADYQTQVRAFRVYKNSTLTVSGAQVAKIEFTCVAEGDEKYGPGCFTTEAGYTFEGFVGTWEGEANEVVFTASSNQVRVLSIKITLAA